MFARIPDEFLANSGPMPTWPGGVRLDPGQFRADFEAILGKLRPNIGQIRANPGRGGVSRPRRMRQIQFHSYMRSELGRLWWCWDSLALLYSFVTYCVSDLA